ncbi:MAG: glycosyltransferase family 4 protein [Proteobacteria bacterium]|nr:glycosyltransferase family 4 protein [Pseudomonadota bacterium]
MAGPNRRGKLRVGLVVQRYGTEVIGGAETHCRMLAEHLNARPEVECVTVFTTCAKSHATWDNEYASGSSSINGVPVQRFPAEHKRCALLQHALGCLVRPPVRASLLDRSWLRAQGPYVPRLVDELDQVHTQYDVFVFFTYLYFPTAVAMPRLAHKALLIPTAHDEPQLGIKVFSELFSLPKGLAYNTEEERALVETRFDVSAKPAIVLGCGVDAIDPPPQADSLATGPYLIYVGRIARGKGCHDLFRLFARFKQEHAQDSFVSPSFGAFRGKELRLIVVGQGSLKLPNRPDIVQAVQPVDDRRKSALLRDAELLVLPSRFESLSLVVLEAWSLGVAVLVNGRCPVLDGQVRRSGGGRSYRSDTEFGEHLAQMLGEPEERRGMGRLGRRYVDQRYRWDVVEDRLLDFMIGLYTPLSGFLRNKTAPRKPP